MIGREWLNRAILDMSHKITSATLTEVSSITTAMALAPSLLSPLHVQFVRQEFSMTKQISPLRQRMIDDMTIRNDQHRASLVAAADQLEQLVSA
jgi:hypothetical protein